MYTLKLTLSLPLPVTNVNSFIASLLVVILGDKNSNTSSDCTNYYKLL